MLLWGVRMVRIGFIRAYGTDLRRMISASTENRILAFFSGMAITAIVQSSTATALMLASFAQRGLIRTAPALAVMLGADVGTTLIAQVMTFDLSTISPLLIGCGVILHMFHEKGGRWRHLARVSIGIGLMLLALTLIRDASETLKHSDTLPLILAPLENEKALGIIFAAIFTWMLHSSLAAVLLFVSLVGGGVINYELGLLLVLGANVGGALVPVIATMKSEPEAARIPMGNMLIRMIGVILILPFMNYIPELLASLGFDPARELVVFHTAFNVGLALLFLPLIGPMSKLGEKIIPNRPDEKNPSKPQYLDDKALDMPVVALAGAARETLRMAEFVEQMFRDTIRAFEHNDEKLTASIQEKDDIVDNIYDAIKLYMTHLSREALDPKEADRYIQIMTFATNLEHIGDIIDNSLMDLARQKIDRQDRFSKEGFQEISEFHKQVLNNMRLAQSIFLSEDPELARRLVEGKEAMRQAELNTSSSHFTRLRNRLPETLATSNIHLDIIRDFRRINTYVTSIAYAILNNAEAHKKSRKSPVV